MREFVRYSPGIEAPDPSFELALHTVLEDLRQQVTASPKFGGRRAASSGSQLRL